MPFPRIVPHQDGAGIVEAVGAGVPESRIGERVWIYEAQLGRAFGTAAELVALPSANAVRLPEGASFAEGAALGVPAMTAHRAVFADGSVSGKTVLVTGGAGAVGFYAVQFASRDGARVIATVSNLDQARVAREAGASLVVLRSDGVGARIAEYAGEERCVDRIVDVAFGANLETSMKLLRRNGVIATYASDLEPEPRIPFWPLVTLDASIRFILVYAMPEAAHAEAARAINEAIEQGWLRHNLGTRLPLEEIARAHELVETGKGGGKVIVELD